MKKIKGLLTIVTIVLIIAISTVTADFPDPVIAEGFDITGVFILFTIFIGTMYTFSRMQQVDYTS